MNPEMSLPRSTYPRVTVCMYDTLVLYFEFSNLPKVFMVVGFLPFDTKDKLIDKLINLSIDKLIH